MKSRTSLCGAWLLLTTGMSFAQTLSAASETVLHNFASPVKGANPYSTLVRDPSGNLYGTAVNGGPQGAGVVFKTSSSGETTILYSFTGKGDGATPLAGVILDASGNLYGTTFSGGGANQGTVYKLDTAGNETVLYSFTGGVDGGSPHAALTLGPSGRLYGTAQAGGTKGLGVIFRVSGSGEETVIHSFQGNVSDGALPTAGVILDSEGNLYGTTGTGGSNYQGVAYKIDNKGNETILHAFSGGADGGSPMSGLTQDAVGNLYGTTSFGGTGFAGVVYKISPSGLQTVLYNFTGLHDGGQPEAGVLLDAAGDLYGTTFLGGLTDDGVIYKIDAKGKETVIESFPGEPGGAHSSAGLTADGAGNLYGTTANGGNGYGVVYRIAHTGKATTLFAFPGVADGFAAYSTVTRDLQGNLYGTTYTGGATANGTVYEIRADGAETVLYSFKGAPDGAAPYAGVVRDAAGNLYGTTESGGASNGGTVYKLSPAGEETVLYSFTGGVDGGSPFGGVTLDAAGNLYGTTNYGGVHYSGVVFKVSAGGKESTVYSFAGGSDGAYPDAGVTLDQAGNLYGATAEGGTGVLGTVYKVNATTGEESVLYNFTGGPDGGFPESPVVLDSAGNIYGTAATGGQGLGVVYKVDQTGNETVLYAFTGGADGANPLLRGRGSRWVG